MDGAAENGHTASKLRGGEDDGSKDGDGGKEGVDDSGHRGRKPRGVEGNGSEEREKREKTAAELPT